MTKEFISRAEALEITTRTCGDYAAAFAEIRKLPADKGSAGIRRPMARTRPAAEDRRKETEKGGCGMSEKNLTVSPERLGAEIRELTRQAKAMTLYYGVEIGRRLEAAKSMVPYGGWGAWLKENTEFSQATATRFMRVFNEYGAAQIGIFGAVPESSTLQNLSISNALRL